MSTASDGRTVLACVAAIVLGGVVSLLTAGPALFADGSFRERPPILLVSIAVFLFLGVAVGAFAPHGWKPASVCLGLSALPVVLFFGPDQVGSIPMMVLAVGFALGDAAAGVLGAWVGARYGLRRR